MCSPETPEQRGFKKAGYCKKWKTGEHDERNTCDAWKKTTTNSTLNICVGSSLGFEPGFSGQ